MYAIYDWNDICRNCEEMKLVKEDQSQLNWKISCSCEDACQKLGSQST